MKRREFVAAVAAGSVGAAAFGCSAGATGARPARTTTASMKVGCQHFSRSKEDLEYLARHGVFNVDGGTPASTEGGGWDVADVIRMKEAYAEYGIRLDALHLSGGGDHFDRWRSIMLGKSPERDREIEIMQQMIEVAGEAGVPLLNYNATILPILRTGRTVDPSRGNASYSTWNYEEAVARGMDDEPTLAGEVDKEEMYDRITYWLDRVIPVAEENDVKMGCHIADPPAPAGYRGITRWNSPDVFEGIRRFAQLYDSPSHGFNLCLGSTAEGLEDPRTEILPIIRWVGERGQIFNIHMRNIKGGYNHFQEVYPDNGDMDFVQVMRVLRDVGYDGMVMPDHIPEHPDPAAERQGHAFAFGYIKGLIQAVSAET